ncbi:hypothetical protein Aph02nite_82990 [Actinoplanes philippinensis]|uniref:DUF3455 domain-containing protein n=1 Tax=Actinoplanes philippinensis TaxID=35752 RepID=A0A1I2MM57_9ACTN|nr:DUF3455 domain-containing protein [Actinoplanes philippinensis]GIE82349.1 hypothetical protein Aph02nite_82990 [Actinoplanes philippinensis]SFF92625.1 Protein of unknown function [Actinoplanes philippinensis]
MLTTRSRISAVAVAAAIGAATVASPALAGVHTDSVEASSRQVGVPLIAKEIRPPAGSKLVGAYIVVSGTQTYTCAVPEGAATGVFTGTPSVPEAQLIGTGGRIHHFGGPTWQSLRDGSLVTASRAAGVNVDGAIPELLLKVETHSGKGVLSRADYINRLRTSGGVAPSGSCTAGQKASVPYGSIYVFWDAPAS